MTAAPRWHRGLRVLLLVPVLGLALVTAPMAGAALGTPASRSTARVAGFDTSRATVRVGGAVWSSITVLPRAARTVTVQYRRAGAARFVTASSGRSSAQGAYDAELMPPSAGVWQFRVVLPATAQARTTISATRVVVASGSAAVTRVRGYDSSARSIVLGDSVADTVSLRPKAPRTVCVQARGPGARDFVTVSVGRARLGGRLPCGLPSGHRRSVGLPPPGPRRRDRAEGGDPGSPADGVRADVDDARCHTAGDTDAASDTDGQHASGAGHRPGPGEQQQRLGAPVVEQPGRRGLRGRDGATQPGQHRTGLDDGRCTRGDDHEVSDDVRRHRARVEHGLRVLALRARHGRERQRPSGRHGDDRRTDRRSPRGQRFHRPDGQGDAQQQPGLRRRGLARRPRPDPGARDLGLRRRQPGGASQRGPRTLGPASTRLRRRRAQDSDLDSDRLRRCHRLDPHRHRRAPRADRDDRSEAFPVSCRPTHPSPST